MEAFALIEIKFNAPVTLLGIEHHADLNPAVLKVQVLSGVPFLMNPWVSRE